MPGGRPRKGGASALRGARRDRRGALVRCPHHGIAAGVGQDVAVALADQPHRVAVDVRAVRVGRLLVGEHVGEQRIAVLLELSGDQGTQQPRLGPVGGPQRVAATKSDAEHVFLAAGERDVKGPQGLVGSGDGGKPGHDTLVGVRVSNQRDRTGEAETRGTECRVRDATLN